MPLSSSVEIKYILNLSPERALWPTKTVVSANSASRSIILSQSVVSAGTRLEWCSSEAIRLSMRELQGISAS